MKDMTKKLDEEQKKLATLMSIMDEEMKELTTPRSEMGSNIVNNTPREIGSTHFI